MLRGLRLQVRELEEKCERLQHDAEAARKELGQLRKDVQHASNKKDDLEGVIRSLQQEELSARVWPAARVQRSLLMCVLVGAVACTLVGRCAAPHFDVHASAAAVASFSGF